MLVALLLLLLIALRLSPWKGWIVGVGRRAGPGRGAGRARGAARRAAVAADGGGRLVGRIGRRGGGLRLGWRWVWRSSGRAVGVGLRWAGGRLAGRRGTIGGPTGRPGRHGRNAKGDKVDADRDVIGDTVWNGLRGGRIACPEPAPNDPDHRPQRTIRIKTTN